MHQSRRRTMACMAVLAAMATAASAETYEIDVVHSSVEFSIRHLVSRTTGGFTDFSGSIAYDPARPAATKIEGTIQVASIDTRNAQRDGHLTGPDFLDAAKYPTITFKSTEAAARDGHLMVTGDFTMHGVTRQVTLMVEVLGMGTHPRSKKPVLGMATETVLKRSDYGVDTWTDVAGVLGDEVEVTLTIEAIGM